MTPSPASVSSPRPPATSAEYEQLIIGILDDPGDPVSLPPAAPVLVDAPGTTQWTAAPALAVPTTC
ncbi:hypothetical protein ACFV5N_14245 [Streptomyces sp. NPDC059853]|uniref:hypothetical protein n=1 Tax=Streptomyces sp. NPDC059853 TaxID=3346973 RepID=UPI00364CDEAF